MNRYYSSQVARFTSPDPSGSADQSSPQSWNQYTYSLGDPVNHYDPTGLDATWVPESAESGGEGSTGLVSPGAAVNPGPQTAKKAPNDPPRPKQCNSQIFKPKFLKIFSDMGKTLHVHPEFIMALSVEESGWNLAHVFETNSSSGGQPLNNLFGVAPGGKNNKAFPSVEASGTWWVQNFGVALKDPPKTIADFVWDLQHNNPLGPYNSKNPDWATEIEGGTYTQDHGPQAPKGSHTPGTYQSLLNWMTLCGITLP